VETRLLVRHDDGAWGGYAYAWLDDDSDAVLTDDALLVPAGNRDEWRIPSRGECLQCHTEVAGFDLGLTIGQLNREFTYPSTGITANQLTTFDRAGLLEAALPNTPDQLDAQVDPATAAPPGAARSYLDANCAHCHQPGGPGLGDLDFRIATKDPGGCDELPTQGDLGVVDARVIAPGDASRSIVSVRMHATDGTRMPPVATDLVDPIGTAAVDAWIDGLTGCPP
jgi:mono/diheme cytochrome c family protein